MTTIFISAAGVDPKDHETEEKNPLEQERTNQEPPVHARTGSRDDAMETPIEDFDPGAVHCRAGEFVGRREELITLKSRGLASPGGGAVLITGMGGVGKTCLAARALGDRGKEGPPFTLTTVAGRISLVDLLQEFGCKGHELDRLLDDFFQNRLPAKESETVFLFDDFEDNLSAMHQDAPDPVDADPRPLDDSTTARFLADLINAGKARVLIISRHPFQLPDNRHEALARIDLNALTSAETRELMSRLKGFETLGDEQRARVERYIGGHPGNLALLEAIPRDGRLTCEDVLRRLLDKLPEEARERLSRSEALSDALREEVFRACRDCLVDQLIALLDPPEKEHLFHLSVLKEPGPGAALQWPREREVETDAAMDKLIRLTLVGAAGGRSAVHRWTAARVKEHMSRDQWRSAHRLAADLYREPAGKTIADGLAAWRHCLEGDDPGTAHQAAGELAAQLDVLGHGSLRRIVLGTMVEATREKPRLQAIWLHNTATLECDQGAHETALAPCERALKLYETLGDEPGEANTRHTLGLIHQELGDYKKALAQYGKSLEISDKLGDQNSMTATCRQMGLILQDGEDHEGSLARCGRLLEIYEELGDERGMAGVRHQMGVILRERGDYAGALEHHKQTLELFTQLDDPAGMARSHHEMGNVLHLKGDHDAALDRYGQSLEIKKTLNDQGGMAGTFVRMGLLMQTLGKEREAFDYFFQAFFIYSDQRAPSASKAASHLCDAARRNPGRWREWLTGLTTDEGARGPVEQMILGHL